MREREVEEVVRGRLAQRDLARRCGMQVTTTKQETEQAWANRRLLGWAAQNLAVDKFFGDA